jgi:hypothetical protein
MDHQSVTNLQNLVHGFWEDSKALVYRGSRKTPNRLGQGQYETICELWIVGIWVTSVKCRMHDPMWYAFEWSIEIVIPNEFSEYDL